MPAIGEGSLSDPSAPAIAQVTSCLAARRCSASLPHDLMKHETSSRTALITRVFFIFVAAPMFLVFPYLAQVNNPNENVRTYMAMALVDHHTFTIDAQVKVFGWTNDMAKVPQKDGGTKYFSVKAPANSYIGAPAYAIFKRVAGALGRRQPTDRSSHEDRAWWLRNATWAIRLISVQLPCFLFLVFFERWLRAHVVDPSFRLSAVAALGLGTNFLAYSQMVASHSLEGVCMFSAFALAEAELRRTGNVPRRTSVHAAAAAGLLSGGCVLLEYHALPSAAVVAAFGLYVFRAPKAALAFVLGAAVDVSAMMLFQYFAYGDPFTPGHRMVEDPALAEWHHRGLFGIALPDAEKLWLLSSSPTFGFFGTSPYMVLGLIGGGVGMVLGLRAHASRWRGRLVVAVWCVAMLVLWLVVSAAAPWRGGWTVGPRLLGAAPPFFAFGAASALDVLRLRVRRWRSSMQGIAAGLSLASVLSIGFVALVYNSLPENVARPLLQFALPLSRAGFVAHHVFEWFGAGGLGPWYFVAAALVLAPLFSLVVSAPHRERSSVAVVLAAFVLAFGVGMAPALSSPAPSGSVDLPWFARGWEPAGRDRATRLAASTDPCRHRERAAVFERLGMLDEAATARASALAAGICP